MSRLIELSVPLLALFILFATGCIGVDTGASDSPETLSEAPDSTTSESEHNITKKEDLSEESPVVIHQNKSDGISELSPEKRMEVNRSVREYIESINFTSLAETQSERKELTVSTAEEICEANQEFDAAEITQQRLESNDGANENLLKMKHTVGTVNENFGLDIPRDGFDDLSTKFRKAEKYTPVLNSYTELVNASCSVHMDDEESIERFYLATASMGLDLVLIQHQVYYRTAYTGTGILNSKVGLARVRSICGDSCYALALSHVHWGLRGSAQNTKRYIMNQAHEVDSVQGVKVDLKSVENDINGTFHNYLEKGKDLNVSVENIAKRRPGRINESVSDITESVDDMTDNGTKEVKDTVTGLLD